MRVLLLVASLCLLGFSTGCAGVVKSPDDRANTYSHVLEMDMRQLADDWDGFWLADRQYRLTKWRIR